MEKITDILVDDITKKISEINKALNEIADIDIFKEFNELDNNEKLKCNLNYDNICEAVFNKNNEYYIEADKADKALNINIPAENFETDKVLNVEGTKFEDLKDNIAFDNFQKDDSEDIIKKNLDFLILDKTSPLTNNPPFINFVTFNRLGLTAKNLSNILDSDEDFEMHIIDCNSKDDSWEYIESLNDSRIKSKTRFVKNYGPIYPLNYALTKRKPDQYFITIDSDTFIKTKNWISRFMEVFEAFPEVGMLGLMRDNPYPRFLPPVIPRMNGDISYLELKNAAIGGIMDFIPGHLQCLKPELIKEIGYWSEENGYGDAELSPRVVHYTNFKVGFLITIEIDMTQHLACNECQAQDFCKQSRSVNTCYTQSKNANQNESFVRKFEWKYLETFKELEEGKRTAYCASVLDPTSMESHLYHKDWAEENFNHYIKYSN